MRTRNDVALLHDGRVPVPTWISRMRAGSSKGSSMLMPAGFSGVFE